MVPYLTTPTTHIVDHFCVLLNTQTLFFNIIQHPVTCYCNFFRCFYFAFFTTVVPAFIELLFLLVTLVPCTQGLTWSIKMEVFYSDTSNSLLEKKKINPLLSNTPFFYPLKTSENFKVFCCFHKGRKRVYWERMG